MGAAVGLAGRVADLPAWLQALISALVGAGLAWAYYFGGGVGPVSTFAVLATAVIGVALVAWLAWVTGRRMLDPRIVLGVRLMGLRVWLELAIGAVGVGIGVWIAAAIVPSGSTPSDVTKAVVAGWAAGLSAAVTAGLAKRAEDADDRVGAGVAKAVRGAYVAVFTDANSDGWKAVYSDPIWDISGWGREAREQRATRIAAARATLPPRGPTSAASTEPPAAAPPAPAPPGPPVPPQPPGA